MRRSRKLSKRSRGLRRRPRLKFLRKKKGRMMTRKKRRRKKKMMTTKRKKRRAETPWLTNRSRSTTAL